MLGILFSYYFSKDQREKRRIRAEARNQQGVSVDDYITDMADIALYDLFMVIGVYVIMLLMSWLNESEKFGEWTECVSAVVYWAMIMFVNLVYNFICKNNSLTDETRTVCYRSMMVIQSVCLLLLHFYDIAAMMIAFFFGEILAVTLRQGNELNFAAIINQISRKISEIKALEKRQIISAVLAVFINILLGGGMVYDLKTQQIDWGKLLVGVLIGAAAAGLLILSNKRFTGEIRTAAEDEPRESDR